MSAENVHTNDNLMVKVITIRFGKGLLIIGLLTLILMIITVILSFSIGETIKVMLVGSIVSVAVPFCCYPHVLKRYTSESSLFFSKYSLIKHEDDHNSVQFIDWNEINSYQVDPFESLTGSGFTLKVYPKKGKTQKISFIGINLMDDYNIHNPNSLIFKLIQNINGYNKPQLSQNQIKLLPGFFASNLLSYLLVILSCIVFIAFLFSLSTPYSAKSDLFYFFFAVIVINFMYGKRTRSQRLHEKLYRLHSR